MLEASGDFRELGTYYYLGLLYRNQADAFASSGDREALLGRCESQVHVTLEQGETSRVSLRAELAAFVSDPELVESPVAARMRGRFEQ